MPLTLCALHPDHAVRRVLLERCPSGVPLLSAATPAELAAVSPLTVCVVLLDPARTDPDDVVRACALRPELVSISDLRVVPAEVGVDLALPLRRLTTRRLAQLVFDVAQHRSLQAAS